MIFEIFLLMEGRKKIQIYFLWSYGNIFFHFFSTVAPTGDPVQPKVMVMVAELPVGMCRVENFCDLYGLFETLMMAQYWQYSTYTLERNPNVTKKPLRTRVSYCRYRQSLNVRFQLKFSSLLNQLNVYTRSSDSALFGPTKTEH